MPNALTDMIAMIQFRLGRRKDLAAEIEREINLAQTRLEDSPRLEPWFLVREDETFTVDVGQADVTLPATFLRLSEEEQPQVIVDGVRKPLKRVSLDQANSSYQSVTGTPTAFSQFGDVFRVWPSPDKQYTLRLVYAGREATLVTGTTESNAWTVEAFPLLLNKALIAVANALGNMRVKEDASSDFNTAYAELQTRIVQREDANQTYQRMPGSGDQMTR